MVFEPFWNNARYVNEDVSLCDPPFAPKIICVAALIVHAKSSVVEDSSQTAPVLITGGKLDDLLFGYFTAALFVGASNWGHIVIFNNSLQKK